MTRRHTPCPAWEWACDKCYRVGDELTRHQRDLPTAEEMTARGWHVARLWGDLCPQCVAQYGIAALDEDA